MSTPVSAEFEPITLSALQHWKYCPRQCGLIHLEQVFDDNLHTLRGQAVHARADLAQRAKRQRRARGAALPLWHDELGLIGKSDVVEFLPNGTPYPVEYKHGSRHKAPGIAACDDLHRRAGVVPGVHDRQGRTEGALYYASSRRRRVVPINAELRQEVESTTHAVRQMLASGQLPPPLVGDQAAQRCKGCSLQERCQPQATPSSCQRAQPT